MKKLVLVLLVVAMCNAQSPAPASNVSQFANHHVILVPSSAPGAEEAQWIALGPDGSLSIFPASKVVEKMNVGYRPYTFGEMIEAIGTLAQQNAALAERIKYLEQHQSQTQEQRVTVSVDPQTLQAQEEMQRRAQQRQAALMLLMGMRTPPPQTINLNYSNCNKNPALCIH